MRATRLGASRRRAIGPLVILAGLGLAAVLTDPAAAADPPGEGQKGHRARPDFLNAMIEAAWNQASPPIRPSPEATDAEFLRRAYLDVVGRIPTVNEAVAFLQSSEEGKREKLVDYLLADPDYANNFANQWTVILIGRSDQGRNVDRDVLKTWLRQRFADNRPWNQIAYDLITASGSNQENGAVNFILAHREFDAVPLTSITARVFLGLQIQCTQCHDHPFNDWKQQDFWSINAFFRGLNVRQVRKPGSSGNQAVDHVELSDNPTEAFASYDRRNGMVGIAFPTYLDGRKISQGEDVNRREALGKFITEPQNDDLPRAFVNRMWAHFLGRGFVYPVDDFGPHNPATNPELLDKLADEFRAGGYDIKELIRWIMTSRPYNLSSSMLPQNDKDEVLFSHMLLKPMTPEQLFDSLLTATATAKPGQKDSDQRRDRWLKQFLFTFGSDEGEETSSFQGTIPQALMMMNGPMMEQAVGGQSGSFLAGVLEQTMLLSQRRRIDPATTVINQLFLAALSRPPTSREVARAKAMVSMYPDQLNVMEDLFWALLNSNEFVLNH